MKDEFMRNYAAIPDQYFPINITLHNKSGTGPIFESHWHDHFQFIYCTKGEARILCSGNSVDLAAGEVIVINTHEMHYGESLQEDISYYVIMVDLSFILSNGVDSCQTKYISPLAQNLLLFENRISRDREICNCIEIMIDEYNTQKPGYELAVKAAVYNAIVLLLRNHVARSFNKKEYDVQIANMKRFQSVFHYIGDNLGQEIELNKLAEIACLSTGHFCRVFKRLTGKSAIAYINQLRVEKAALLLEQGEASIKEIAFATGFCDTNYFSRVFRKYKGLAPNQILHRAGTIENQVEI